jgi:hypothetical protein
MFDDRASLSSCVLIRVGIGSDEGCGNEYLRVLSDALFFCVLTIRDPFFFFILSG